MKTTFFTLSAVIAIVSGGCSDSHNVEAPRELAETMASATRTTPTVAAAGTRSAAPALQTVRPKVVTEEERAMRQRSDEEADAKVETSVDTWAGFGGGLDQTFARVHAPIDRSNLTMLGTAWEKTAPGGVTGTPAVYDGVVYWTDWVGNVHADNANDGTEIWSKRYDRGFTSSPFVTEDSVYLSNRDNMVYALERASGKERWVSAVIESELAQLWSSPTVVDGVVIVGLGCKGTSDGFIPYDAEALMAFRGGVVGLDAKTGKVRWRWDNTRGADGTEYGPGVSTWSTAAVDTKRKVAYIGAGNSYYSPASPYSDALLALDYMTDDPKGHLVWSRQFTEDDNFTSGSPLGPDYDVGATPSLYSLDGKDYVAVGDKGGRFYILDRETGDLLSTTAAGSGSALGGVIAPAAYGGGALYQAANNLGAAVVQRIDAKTGESQWSTTLNTGVCFGAPLLLKDVLLVGTASAFPSSRAQPGEIVALDRQTGERVADWSLSVANQRGGGISIYHNTLFIPYGYVFENSAAESTLSGGLLAAAIGGKVMQPPKRAPEATHAPKYSAIYSEILEPQGCTADRCHGGLGLKLAKQDSGFKSLHEDVGVGVCAGMKMVVPGKPNESLLYRKVADEQPPCGARMPLSLMPLSAEQLTQIRTWIEQGAEDN